MMIGAMPSTSSAPFEEAAGPGSATSPSITTWNKSWFKAHDLCQCSLASCLFFLYPSILPALKSPPPSPFLLCLYLVMSAFDKDVSHM